MVKMNKIVWKVVSRKNEQYFSALMPSSDEMLYLEYKIGQVTKPKIGKIFAFNQLSMAKTFASTDLDKVIMKCKAIASEYQLDTDHRVIPDPSTEKNPSRLKVFWMYLLHDERKALSELMDEIAVEPNTIPWEAWDKTILCSAILPISFVDFNMKEEK